MSDTEMTEDRLAQLIVDHLYDASEPQTTAEVAEAVSIDRQRAYRALKLLDAAGLIIRIGRTKGTKWAPDDYLRVDGMYLYTPSSPMAESIGVTIECIDGTTYIEGFGVSMTAAEFAGFSAAILGLVGGRDEADTGALVPVRSEAA